MSAHRAWLLVPLLLVSCRSWELPEGTGKGLVSYDREAPAGARVVARPHWKVGDRFVYLRGGQVRLAQQVSMASEEGYVLEHEQSGIQTLLTPDLASIGVEMPGDETQARRLDPPEVVLHWPLWEGKRWSCHFQNKIAGQDMLPLLTTYHCEGWEEVDVPAGRFSCLRIVRRSRPAMQGEFMERANVLWYAPEVGYFARRLENGLILELVELHRQ